MALRTDGVNQYGATLGFKGVTGDQNRTITWWTKPGFFHADCFWGWGTEAPGQRFLFQQHQGPDRLTISIHSGNRNWAIGNLYDGNWHFLVVTLDGNNVNQMTVELDNVPLAIISTVAKVINTGNATDVRLSWASAGGYMEADNYDFRIYSCALSADEKTELFTGQGCDSVSADRELWLKFGNEESTCSIERDLSGHDRHMSSYNKPVYVADIFAPCPPAIEQVVYEKKQPKVLVLNSEIDLYALGYVTKLGKTSELKTFQRDKVIVPQITIPVHNIDDQFNPSNPNAIFNDIHWRYQPIRRYDEDGNLTWDGIIDDFPDDQKGKIAGILSKNALLKFFKTRIAYESTGWETPGDAFKNICDAYGMAYNTKYVTDSIAVYTENNCYIKCHFDLGDGVTFQQAVESISKFGAADCYSANNEMCYKLWTPFTGGVKFHLENSNLSVPVKSKLSRVYYNNYIVGYVGDGGVSAVDANNNYIGKISVANNNSQDIVLDGSLHQQIEIKDLASAVFLGEQHIRRTHINLNTNPFPPLIIRFSSPYEHKDYFTIQTFFRLTNESKGWDDKLFETYGIEKDFAGRLINIVAYEVDE